MNDVHVSEDERAVVRLFAKAAAEASVKLEVAQNDELDHVIAKLAAERGWSIADIARAIVGDAGARVDDLRDSAPHAKARRIHNAVQRAIEERVSALDRQLEALRSQSRPMDAAPALLAGALIAFVSGREVSLDALTAALQAERDRLASLLKGGRRHRQSGFEPPTVGRR